MCCRGNCVFVSASLLLTATCIAVGISFFGPFWLANIGQAANETEYTSPKWESYLPGPNNQTWKYPDRGLWAQCGASCVWFWTDNYRIQSRLFTPLQWHLATQILYFIAAVIILVSEIMARVQLCCTKRKSVYISLGVMVLISAILQLAAVAVFGGLASKPPYNAISDPAKFSQYLGQAFDPTNNPVTDPFLGWCYWMAVVGGMLSVIAGVLFLISACCMKRSEEI